MPAEIFLDHYGRNLLLRYFDWSEDVTRVYVRLDIPPCKSRIKLHRYDPLPGEPEEERVGSSPSFGQGKLKFVYDKTT